MSNPVLVQSMPGLVQILLNRPDKKNAITACMYGLLADAITAAVADTSIKVIVLGSANEHFTAGNDLGDFLANPSLEIDSPVYRFLNALMYCPLPVVAAVQGCTGPADDWRFWVYADSEHRLAVALTGPGQQVAVNCRLRTVSVPWQLEAAEASSMMLECCRG